jgi:hypothetical protein
LICAEKAIVFNDLVRKRAKPFSKTLNAFNPNLITINESSPQKMCEKLMRIVDALELEEKEKWPSIWNRRTSVAKAELGILCRSTFCNNRKPIAQIINEDGEALGIAPPKI